MLYRVKNSVCVSEEILDAAHHIESLVSVEPDSKASVLARLQKAMAPMPLSCCIAVCTYAVFSHFYEQDAQQERCFLDAFHNLQMNKLRHQSHYYDRKPIEALEKAKLKQSRFMSHTFFDLSKAASEKEILKAEITRLEQEISESAPNTLSHFLFIADVVVHLEEQNLLLSEQTVRIKADLLQHPIEWIKRLLPAMLQLSTLAYSKEETAESSYKAVIEAILSGVNICLSPQTTALQDLQQTLLDKYLEKHMDKPTDESASPAMAGRGLK
ncbi:hypothetical protein [Legionella yabuuchiae]|uniref:hypothetical protein n=1 Tax=Legionella yabuuchiae TaxID=376727 RepID=UPI001054A5B0|nr:hypothetical protein [Legionella yabuuchiae]